MTAGTAFIQRKAACSDDIRLAMLTARTNEAFRPFDFLHISGAIRFGSEYLPQLLQCRNLIQWSHLNSLQTITFPWERTNVPKTIIANIHSVFNPLFQNGTEKLRFNTGFYTQRFTLAWGSCFSFLSSISLCVRENEAHVHFPET